MKRLKYLWIRYLGNKEDRSAFYTGLSFLINALTGFGMLGIGLYNLSPFTIVNSVYYLILFSTRAHAVKQYANMRLSNIDTATKFNIEYRVFHRTGAFIIVLGLCYAIINLYWWRFGEVATEGYYAMLATATLGFVKIGVAIRGMIVNRHFKNPIISMIKRVSLIDGVVSIVVTQKAILSFENARHTITSTALFGIACGVIFILFGIYMFLKKQTSLSFYPEDVEADKVVI